MVYKFLQRVFSFDCRSLALMRIAVGMVVLSDLYFRAVDFYAFYTDFGAVPRSLVLENNWNPFFWSLHILSGDGLVIGSLFVLAALCSMLLIVGYQTKIVSIVSWVLLVSLQVRSPLVLQAGDIALHLLLFWGCFLPWGKFFSLDSLNRKGTVTASKHSVSLFSFVSIVFMLQWALIYWHAAFHKEQGLWLTGDAVYKTLQLERYARYPFANWALWWLKEYPALSTYLSFIVVKIELLGPFLLFLPITKWWWRSFIVAFFIMLHASFSLFISVGLFSAIMIAGWCAFLPTSFWQKFIFRAQSSNLKFIGSNKAVNLFAVFCFLLVVCWNHYELPKSHKFYFDSHSWIKNAALMLRLDQKWSMFAPSPSSEDGWYVIPGVLNNGKKVELWQDNVANRWQKPLAVSRTYKRQRWRKYLENLMSANNTYARSHFAQYLCRKNNFNKSGIELLKKLKIYFMMRYTPNWGELQRPIKKMLLLEHQCFH